MIVIDTVERIRIGETEMHLFQRKKKAVRWLAASLENKVSIGETILRAALLLPAVLLVLFSGVSMLRDVWSEFSLGGSKTVFLIAEILVCTVLYEILLPCAEGKMREKTGKRFRFLIVGAGVFLLWIVTTSVYRRAPLEMEDGFLMVGNRFLELYNEAHRTAYVMDRGLMEEAPFAVTCLLAGLTFLAFNLSYLTGKNGYWTAVPLAVWGAELLAGTSPLWLSVTLFLTGWYLLSAAGTTGHVGRALDNKGRPVKTSLWKSFGKKVLTAFLLLDGMLVLSFVMKAPAQHLVQESRLASVMEHLQERFAGGGETRLDLDFFAEGTEVSNEAPEYQDEVILEVETDGMPETTVYLKDFEGMNYRNGEWVSGDSLLRGYCLGDDMDDKQVTRIRRMLNEEGYGFFASRTDTGESFEKTPLNYTIKYHRLERDAYPLPYFPDTGEVSASDLTGDVLVEKGLLRRKVEFSAPGGSVFSREDISGLSNRAIPQESADLWNWYDSYALKKYLSVPQDLAGVFSTANVLTGPDPYLGISRINRERLDTAYRVASFLRRYEYSMDLEELNKGADPVEYFLTEGHEGYCVHFASAGVLILRALGVPARYVEGYLLRRQAFSEGEDGVYTAEVLDRNRHAWAEIYLNHVGWIPVEMTNGFSEGSAALQVQGEGVSDQQSQPPSGGPGETAQEAEETPGEDSQEAPAVSGTSEESAENPQESVQETIPEKEEADPGLALPAGPGQGTAAGQGKDRPGFSGGSSGMGAGVLKVLKGLVLLCLAGAVLWGGVRLLQSRIREYYKIVDREFARGRYASMVRRINRRLMAGLRRRGKTVGRYPTDAEYGGLLKKQFPDISGDDWDRYMEIVKEAAFSRNELEQEQARFCREIYQKVRLLREDGKR